jgi:hypothetical protein
MAVRYCAEAGLSCLRSSSITLLFELSFPSLGSLEAQALEYASSNKA